MPFKIMLPPDDPVIADDIDNVEEIYEQWMNAITWTPSELHLFNVTLIGKKSHNIQFGTLNIEIRGTFPPHIELPKRPTSLIFPVNTKVLLTWDKDNNENVCELLIDADGRPLVVKHGGSRKSRKNRKSRRKVTRRQ